MSKLDLLLHSIGLKCVCNYLLLYYGFVGVICTILDMQLLEGDYIFCGTLADVSNLNLMHVLEGALGTLVGFDLLISTIIMLNALYTSYCLWLVFITHGFLDLL